MPRASARRSRRKARTVPTLADFRRHLLAHADRIAPADVTALAGDAHRVDTALAARPALDGKVAERLRLAVALLRDHADGRCPQIPYRTVSLLAAAVLYFLEPVDVIPDCIPGAGSLDDALIVDLAWRLGRDGIDRWLAARG